MGYISAIKQGDQVVVWERTSPTERVKKTYDAPYYFYIKSNQGEYTSIYDDTLARFDFPDSSSFIAAKQQCESDGIKMFESDIPPELKVLSKHYYGATVPKLNVSFLDIEVDYNKSIGFSSVANPYAPINAVAIYHQHKKRFVVLAIVPTDAECDVPTLGEADANFIKQLNDIAPLGDFDFDITFCRDERDLLLRLLNEVEDSDVLSGWNSDFFDIPYIGKRLELIGSKYFRRLSFRDAKTPRWREIEKFGQPQMMLELSGRVTLDYLELFKKYEVAERPSYKLESIADEVLPELPKLEYEGSLADLYRKNFAYFIRYNIRDTEILKGFEDRQGYVALANEMVHLSTGDFKHVGGTLKLAELATVNYCHHVLGGLIVNDLVVSDQAGQIQGATVLTPKVGMHEYVGSVDINSLYPSAIRSINISPETIRGQFVAEVKAAEEIAKKSTASLELRFENGESEERTATEWREYLTERKWAVSGFGTIFDQTKQGIIPRILEDWYAQRKVYQKKMRDALTAAESCSQPEDYLTLKDEAAYYDRIQYVYKIKLNSFYGALTNRFFRFYDLRMGESTTGTGRMILQHQCAKTNEILKGVYDLHGSAIVYGDSVAGSTIIETSDGPVTIESLFGNVDYTKGTKEYSNCDVKALTLVDCNHNEFRPVKYVMRHKVHKKMYRLWIGNTRYVDVTEDHSLMGYANSKHAAPGIIEVKPTEIGKGNINSLILNSHIPVVGMEQPISKEMCMLIGLLIGDGHVESKARSGVGLSIGCEDKEDIINTVLNPLIEQGWFTSIVHMKNTHDVRLCGVKGWKYLRQHMYSNGTKQFPDWITSTTVEQIRFVLSGYFTADGYANKNKTIGLCSTNMAFVEMANRLLKLCGIGSNYWTETTENSFKGKFSGTHTIRLTVYNAVKFGQEIGFLLSRKNKNVRTAYTTKTRHHQTQTGYCLITPTKIEEIEHSGYVYDIEVDDTHTFYANDLLVHNTDSTYFHTFAKDADTAIEIADGVGDLVNESFSAFMADSFLVRDEFNDIIACGREIVSDRGIFVDKKRYILHLIDLDGRRVDKLKVMGLDTKKTTMPKEVSAKLNSFIERYLKGEEWDIIATEIVDYKDMLRATDVMAIGLPKGIKGIEKYTQELEVYGDGVRLPGHVAAGILYNKCRVKYDDKESPPIISGMKIKVFYLTSKVGRFKSIAIPVDIETVPKWFLTEFVVDRDAHIERLVDNPLLNIIKAIDKSVPTKQNLLVASLLNF